MQIIRQNIGLRTIKTGIAVMLSIIVANLLDFEYPFFIAMTALISMDKTMGNSLKMGRNRVVGTFLGACIGIALAYLDRGNAVLCGLGMIMLIMICNRLHLQGSITIGGIVLVAIMVHTDKTPLFYGFHRTLDTLIGAFLSFVVNATVFPFATVKRLDEMMLRLWDKTDLLVKELKDNQIVSFGEIKKDMDEIGIELLLYHNEFMFQKKRDYVKKLEKHYDMGKRLLLEAEICQTIDAEKHPEVFDYHIQNALNIYDMYIEELQSKYKNAG